MVAPGKAAPVPSVTRPSTRAVAVCAMAGAAARITRARARNNFARKNLVMFPPLDIDRGGLFAGVYRYRKRHAPLLRAGRVTCHAPDGPVGSTTPVSA